MVLRKSNIPLRKNDLSLPTQSQESEELNRMNRFNQYNLDQPIDTTMEKGSFYANGTSANPYAAGQNGSPATHDILGGNQASSSRMISFTTQGTKLIRTAQLQEGPDYYFNIVNLKMRNNVVGQYGNYDQVFITYTISKDGISALSEITVPYTLSTKADSQFMKLMSQFRPIFEGQNITLDQLIGLSGRCAIFHYQAASGAVYDQVEITNVHASY